MASFFWNWKVINILFHAVNLPNQLLRFSLDVAVAFFLSWLDALHWLQKTSLPNISHTATLSLFLSEELTLYVSSLLQTSGNRHSTAANRSQLLPHFPWASLRSPSAHKYVGWDVLQKTRTGKLAGCITKVQKQSSMSPQRGRVLLEKWCWDWSSNQSLWALSGLWHEVPFKLSISLSGKGELSGPDHSKAPSNVLGVGQHTVPTFSYILFLLRSVYHGPLKMGPRAQKGKFRLSRTSQLLGNFKVQRRLGISLPRRKGG